MCQMCKWQGPSLSLVRCLLAMGLVATATFGMYSM